MRQVTGIGSWPQRAARRAAQRPAMTFGEMRTTYAEMASRVARFARVLHDAGVNSGDRVAYLGGNHPAFLETLFATAALGAIFVPLNARLSAAEIDFMLADSGASLLLFGAGSASTVEGLDAASRPGLIAVEGYRAGAIDDTSMIGGASEAPVLAGVDPDSPCMIMYTSGTTGRPKGVVLTHHNITWNCLNVLVDVDLRSDEVTLVTAPMFHTAALNMTCLPTVLKGGHLVIEPRFDVDAVIDAIERLRAHHVRGPHGVTALAARRPLVAAPAALWRRPGADLVDHPVSGAGPVLRPGVRHDRDGARRTHGRSATQS
jgi:fatty-acyl-CoA synthase